MKSPIEIVENIRLALETRNYTDFVNCFAEDGVLELPFALADTPSRFEGIGKIRERFGDSSALHHINKLFELHKVNATTHQSVVLDTMTVELSIAGKNIASGKIFKVSSSIAVIRFKDGKIVHYRDYPNTIGLAGAFGILPQLASSLLK